MSRLIDADKLIDYFYYGQDDKPIIDGLADRKIIEIIKAQPTAYDVENVVTELEYQKEQCEKDRLYWIEHPWKDRDVFNEQDVSSKKAECYIDAIDIARKGGV